MIASKQREIINFMLWHRHEKKQLENKYRAMHSIHVRNTLRKKRITGFIAYAPAKLGIADLPIDTGDPKLLARFQCVTSLYNF